MILRKYYDGEDILGLKVNGGQPLLTGTGTGGSGVGGPCGAIVEKVKRGSVADLEGRIRPGKVHPPSIQPSHSLTFLSISSIYL